MTNTPTQKPVLPEAEMSWREELLRRFVRSHGPISNGANDVQEAESWIEANPEELEEFIYSAITTARLEERMRILNSLPRKFWEDEDHAVGGYISKKDLKELLTSQGAVQEQEGNI